MPDFSRSIDISASADKVFAFVSDVSNMPRYVPTMREAKEDGHGKVHVEGAADGRNYSNDGHIFVDADRRLMRWGSGESAYRGELVVSDAPGGAHVAISLHFHDAPDAGAGEIESTLDTSLERLR
jgi:uncharacterized membrane protein